MPPCVAGAHPAPDTADPHSPSPAAPPADPPAPCEHRRVPPAPVHWKDRTAAPGSAPGPSSPRRSLLALSAVRSAGRLPAPVSPSPAAPARAPQTLAPAPPAGAWHLPPPTRAPPFPPVAAGACALLAPLGQHPPAPPPPHSPDRPRFAAADRGRCGSTRPVASSPCALHPPCGDTCAGTCRHSTPSSGQEAFPLHGVSRDERRARAATPGGRHTKKSPDP